MDAEIFLKTQFSISIVQTMYRLESYKDNYFSGTLNDLTFVKNMSTILAEKVRFESPYTPVNQTLAPLFEDQTSFDELMELYKYQRDFTNITSTIRADDVAFATSDSVLYYYQNHAGRFGEGEEVSWVTGCKLTFNATTGKIQEIWLTVMNSEPLNHAYATEI